MKTPSPPPPAPKSLPPVIEEESSYCSEQAFDSNVPSFEDYPHERLYGNGSTSISTVSENTCNFKISVPRAIPPESFASFYRSMISAKDQQHHPTMGVQHAAKVSTEPTVNSGDVVDNAPTNKLTSSIFNRHTNGRNKGQVSSSSDSGAGIVNDDKKKPVTSSSVAAIGTLGSKSIAVSSSLPLGGQLTSASSWPASYMHSTKLLSQQQKQMPEQSPLQPLQIEVVVNNSHHQQINAFDTAPLLVKNSGHQDDQQPTNNKCANKSLADHQLQPKTNQQHQNINNGIITSNTSNQKNSKQTTGESKSASASPQNLASPTIVRALLKDMSRSASGHMTSSTPISASNTSSSPSNCLKTSSTSTTNQFNRRYVSNTCNLTHTSRYANDVSVNNILNSALMSSPVVPSPISNNNTATDESIAADCDKPSKPPRKIDTSSTLPLPKTANSTTRSTISCNSPTNASTVTADLSTFQQTDNLVEEIYLSPVSNRRLRAAAESSTIAVGGDDMTTTLTTSPSPSTSAAASPTFNDNDSAIKCSSPIGKLPHPKSSLFAEFEDYDETVTTLRDSVR